MLDAATAWVKLGAYVAFKPSHGRADLLSAMARIADEQTMPEEDFQRALRLAMPSFAELLFDRAARNEAPRAAAADDPDDRLLHAAPERPTIAA